jgi:hypothetical protein
MIRDIMAALLSTLYSLLSTLYSLLSTLSTLSLSLSLSLSLRYRNLVCDSRRELLMVVSIICYPSRVVVRSTEMDWINIDANFSLFFLLRSYALIRLVFHTVGYRFKLLFLPPHPTKYSRRFSPHSLSRRNLRSQVLKQKGSD